MTQLRAPLADMGFKSLYPCARLEDACPIASRSGDWCHQILRTRHAPGVDRLAQIARLDRNHMPMIAHFYQRSPCPAQAPVLTRFLGESKFASEWEACENNAIQGLAFLKKDMLEGHRRRLDDMAVGDRLNAEKREVRKDGRWRAILKDL